MESKKFRVDVEYVISRLHEILRRDNLETVYSSEKNDYVKVIHSEEVLEFLAEMQINQINHEEKINAN